MKVVTSVVNNPLFIHIQFHTLRRYLKNDYEFIVFNDAKDFPDFTNGGSLKIRKIIENTCNHLGIQCINIPNDHHKEFSRYDGCAGKAACLRTEDSLRFILQYQIDNPDLYLGLDSDMFLINDFDINRYAAYSAAIVPQYRNIKQEVNYFWNGFYYFDFNRIKNIDLLNWDGIPELSCDSGGMMKDWLALQDKQDLFEVKHLISNTWDKNDAPNWMIPELLDFLESDQRNQNNKFFCELYDGAFLHYRAGGNWNGEGFDFHILQANKLKEVLC